MTTVDDAFPSKYLKASDIPTDTILTIDTVINETVGIGDEAEEKPVAYFREIEKGLVLNKTNATVIGDMHGKEMDNWGGKAIVLYSTEVEYKGKTTLAIRVRLSDPMAKKIGATEFYARAYELDMSKTDARLLLDAHHGDFAAALEALNEPA